MNETQPKEKPKSRLATPLLIAAFLVGAGASAAIVSKAQTTTSPTSTSSTSTNADKPHGHAPIGGDGIVKSVSGTTVVMAEEADEGGTTYTVDASSATVTKNGATAQLSGLSVGDKIFVQGTVSGTTVKATSISAGMHGGMMKHPDNDTETNDDTPANPAQ